ncbi:hypothetical protein D1007_34151 [Hordeum vulgare]|nr:hypothetical protein D1007_34151 [Hordeum vulgare]
MMAIASGSSNHADVDVDAVSLRLPLPRQVPQPPDPAHAVASSARPWLPSRAPALRQASHDCARARPAPGLARLCPRPRRGLGARARTWPAAVKPAPTAWAPPHPLRRRLARSWDGEHRHHRPVTA